MSRGELGGQKLFGARASMEPAGFAVSCRAGGEAFRVSLDTLASASSAGGEARVEASFNGEVLELAIVAERELFVDACRVFLRHAFASDELVLLNGYQSWTDTVERPAWSTMRGLHGVPRAVVKRYALDALGDYSFVDYPMRAGEAHGFTYATFRRGEGMVLVASLDETHGFTLIRTDAKAGRVVLETEAPLGPIGAGERKVLGRYIIARGTSDECYDRWFLAAGIEARPVKPLVGYTSWYRHYGDIDEHKLLADLAGMKAAGPAARAGAHGKPEQAARPADTLGLFQVDDGYCKVGDWLECDAGKFPQGLAPLAARIREAGFLPGLWVAPFVCERDSRVFNERSEWLLRDKAGDPVPTGSHWSGGFALDTRNVEVRSYVLDALRTMTGEWGFGLLKVDFLYAACLLPHDGMNRGELMADAMRLLRTGAGDGTLILGCGVPLASAFGVVDYCRIGCDVGLDWDDKPYMRALHRERVSTKNSLANTLGREPLDGRAFGNDPDVFFLRDDVKLTDAQRDGLLLGDAVSGSVLLTSDDRSAWSSAQRRSYDEAFRVFMARQEARR